VAGVPVDWSRLHGDEHRRRVPLPTYPFERKRFWIDAPLASSARVAMAEMQKGGALEDRSGAAQLSEPDHSQEPASLSFATGSGEFASKGEIEKILSKLWQEVLGVNEIGIHDNFYDLGGQSLMAVTLVNEVGQVFGRRFALQSLLSAPTIHQFSEVIMQGQQSREESGRIDGNSIAAQVRSFILENYPPPHELRDSDSFSEFGIIDEGSVLHLISFLEETYGITVPDSDLNFDNIDSIDTISRYVLRRLEGGRQKTTAGVEKR
jgi:acyl carrier protein